MAALDLAAVRLRLQGVVSRDVQLIVLFGSAAGGRTTPRSDVDVAVLCDRLADFDALFLALAPVFRTERLDIVDLRRAGPVLSFQVACSGVLIFERTQAGFHEFQSLASRRFADTRKLRDAQRRAIDVFLHSFRTV